MVDHTLVHPLAPSLMLRNLYRRKYVGAWKDELLQLCQWACTQPHAAFTAYTHGWCLFSLRPHRTSATSLINLKISLECFFCQHSQANHRNEQSVFYCYLCTNKSHYVQMQKKIITGTRSKILKSLLMLSLNTS